MRRADSHRTNSSKSHGLFKILKSQPKPVPKLPDPVSIPSMEGNKLAASHGRHKT